MELVNLVFTKLTSLPLELSNGETIKLARWKLDGSPVCSMGLGLDPGRNFGLTIVTKKDTIVYAGSIPKNEPFMYTVLMWNIIDVLLIANHLPLPISTPIVIENAAFGTVYGREMLEGIRSAVLLRLWLSGHRNIHYVAPAKIRKAVFGGGKVKAADVWPILNHNGADSLACCLYAGKFRYPEG